MQWLNQSLAKSFISYVYQKKPTHSIIIIIYSFGVLQIFFEAIAKENQGISTFPLNSLPSSNTMIEIMIKSELGTEVGSGGKKSYS